MLMNSGTNRVIWIKAYLSSSLIIFLEGGMGSINVSFLILQYLSHPEYLLSVNFFRGWGVEGAVSGEKFLLHTGKIHLPYFPYVDYTPQAHPAKFCPESL